MYSMHGRTPDQMIAALTHMRDQAAAELDEYLRKATSISPELWAVPLRVVANMVDGISRTEAGSDESVIVTGAVDRKHVVPLAGLAALAITQSNMPATALFALADSVDGANAMVVLYAMCTNQSPDPGDVEWLGQNLDALDSGDIVALVCIAGRGLHSAGITAQRLIDLADRAESAGPAE